MSGKICFSCGEFGHIARHCNANDDINDGDIHEETRTCYRCQQPGHIARDCNKHSQPIQCCHCNDCGHIDRDCEIVLDCCDYKEIEYRENNYPYPSIQKNYSQPNLNIQIRKGYLTNQHVDTIVVCSSSDILRESVIQAAGPFVRDAYEQRKNLKIEHQSFAVQCSNLPCKQILFLPWTPRGQHVFNEFTIKKFMSEAIAYVLSQNYTSIAFPAIGCGQFGLNVDFIAETMINHVKIEGYPLNIKFIIHPKSNDVFNAFRKATAATLITDILPDVWCYTNKSNSNLRVPVITNTLEWNTIVSEFNKTMFGNYKRINRIEHIQNDRWHKQYLIHREDFQDRFKMNTEKFLYHGCSNIAADRVINEYFNRSFAGVNGTNYGYGAYFSTRANYSHFYAVPDHRGQRCMFFARVLIGYSTLGNKNMKVCPLNYHTTTDGEHIYVTYHDTQAYGQYLIHYQ